MSFSQEPNPFGNFIPNTSRWNAYNALALARASDLAYQDPNAPLFGEAAKSWGFPQFKVLPVVDDIRAVVMRSQQEIIVAFRGTVVPKNQSTDWPDLSNWMTDFEALQTPFTTYFGGPEVGQVHKGFIEALFGVWPSLLDAVKQFQDSGQTLWVTGHSLGGALAVLATAAFTFANRMPVNGLYTYGQPRVGCLTFCTMCDSHFGDQHFRFVNDKDIVTRVPPRIFVHFPEPEFYGHSGKVLFFDNKHVLHTDEHWWNAFLINVSVGTQALPTMFNAPIADHNLENGYIANISTYISNVAAGTTKPVEW
ncbi:MAG: lipase family protein [Verrucomicrobia bacterium]|nr:lipase family protein [Verrucomicrobiota bacterium]